MCSLSYATVEDTTRRIVTYKTGALLIKIDIHNAYRVVSVHPDDLMAYGDFLERVTICRYGSSIWTALCLKIFTALQDAAEWIAQQHGVEFMIHYLDNFLIVTSADTNQGGTHIEDFPGYF